jgi:rhamnogalacturonyl hydrolase YesR
MKPPSVPAPPAARDALTVAGELERYWWERADRSYDPYDGLLGPFPPRRLRASRAWRLAAVQLNKRSPVNLRPLLRVPPSRNAYGVGLFASAGIALAKAGVAPGRERIAERLEWLRAHRVRGGWPYPFPVETKTGSYPSTEPNIICTVFAAHAFLDAAEHLGDDAAAEVARAAATFVVDELTCDAASPFFTYVPGYTTLVHNANLLGAAFVARYGALSGEKAFVEAGVRCLDASVRAIGPDGALVYGGSPSMQWVDGHHTGFVVEALDSLRRDAGLATLDEPIERMAAFYESRLFRDGRPLQAPDRPYPVDSIAGAQGIQTFAKLGGRYLGRARAVAGFMLSRMRTRAGTFVYMRRRTHSKAVPYARWCDAPMSMALAVLGTELGREDLD